MTTSYAVGVLGRIAQADLGFVLPHEHLTVDNRIHHIPAAGLAPDATVTASILGDLRVWPHAVLSNLVLDDDEAAADELVRYRGLGGQTLVELTPKRLGRDLSRLERLARRSGVNVIAGTAYYVARSHGDAVASRTIDDLTAEFVNDLTVGSPRSGVMGEIGISREPDAGELKVLRGALLAQERTGAPIWIHISTLAPLPGLLKWLDQHASSLGRIVICHADYDLRDLTLHREALAMGLTVEFDLFGFMAWTRRNFVHAPTDTVRLECLLRLADEGHRERLLISHDLCQKLQLTAYGGYGLGHLLAHGREVFLQLGGSPALFDQISRANPARLLAWESP